MLIAVRGEKNSGKTAFIEKLIERLRGYRIIVIKSSEHATVDIHGKDTSRYREAGAEAAMIVAEKETAIFLSSMQLSKAIKLARKFMPDLIVVEGYKKVESLGCRVIDVEDVEHEKVIEEIAKEIEKSRKRISIFIDGKELPLNRFVEEMIYKTTLAMLSCLRGGEGKEVEIIIRNHFWQEGQ